MTCDVWNRLISNCKFFFGFQLEVDFVIGRYIQPHMVDDIISTLENW